MKPQKQEDILLVAESFFHLDTDKDAYAKGLTLRHDLELRNSTLGKRKYKLYTRNDKLATDMIKRLGTPTEEIPDAKCIVLGKHLMIPDPDNRPRTEEPLCNHDFRQLAGFNAYVCNKCNGISEDGTTTTARVEVTSGKKTAVIEDIGGVVTVSPKKEK